MEWQEFIRQWPANDVIRWLKAPQRTIYDWRAGNTAPPLWQQAIFKEALERAQREDGQGE